MKQPFQDWRIFIAVTVLAALPHIYVAYGSTAAPLFALALCGWGLVPLAIGFVIFRLHRQYAAWGWIVLVTAHNYVVLVTVPQSESSTAALDYVTAPLLNVVIVGPLGALVGVLLARAVQRAKPSD
jgi:hypothetical protein